MALALTKRQTSRVSVTSLALPPVLALTHCTLKMRDMKKQARVSVAQASLELEI